jgi:hypothetical protein
VGRVGGGAGLSLSGRKFERIAVVSARVGSWVVLRIPGPGAVLISARACGGGGRGAGCRAAGARERRGRHGRAPARRHRGALLGLAVRDGACSVCTGGCELPCKGRAGARSWACWHGAGAWGWGWGVGWGGGLGRGRGARRAAPALGPRRTRWCAAAARRRRRRQGPGARGLGMQRRAARAGGRAGGRAGAAVPLAPPVRTPGTPSHIRPTPPPPAPSDP